MRAENKTHQPTLAGYVLLAVISVLGIAAALAALTITQARNDAAIVRTAVDSARLRTSIEAGISRAVFLLGEPDGFRADGRVLRFELDGLGVQTRLVDDRGMIALNTADQDLLSRVIAQLAPSDTDSIAIAAAITDWRDADNTPRAGGAENAAYQSQDLPNPGNRPFVHVAELRRVMGMTDELYASISPAFSVTTRNPTPDTQYAPFFVLNLLGLSELEVSRILNARETALTPIPAPASPASRIYHGFVDAHVPSGAGQRNMARAEKMIVRVNERSGRVDLYGRQVIDYNTSNAWFEPNQ